MTIGTIGTFALFQTTLNDVSTVETNLTNEQQQLSSGNQFQNFADMGGQTQQFLSLSDSIARTTQYLDNHRPIEANVNSTSSILSQVITTATNLQNLMVQRLTGVQGNANFSGQLNASWQTLVGQLNTNVGNQYLFAGSATTTQPVNTTTFPELAVPGVPDAGYYQGSTQDLTTRIDDSTVVTYNVRADAPAFQNIFAGLAMAKQGDTIGDNAMIQQAESLVAQGIQGVIALQATVGSTQLQLTTSDTNLNNQKLYWQGLQQSIGNTDIVSVSTQVAVNQSILQAAFQSFARITSLSLESFLPHA